MEKADFVYSHQCRRVFAPFFLSVEAVVTVKDYLTLSQIGVGGTSGILKISGILNKLQLRHARCVDDETNYYLPFHQ